MNYSFIILILLSFDSRSDQGEILAKARDHFIDQAIKNIKKYCHESLPSRSLDSTYICRLQIKADCSAASEKQKEACEAHAQIQDLEKKITSSDKALAQLGREPLYSSRPFLKEKVPNKKEAFALANPLYQNIAVRRGSSMAMAPKVPEALADSEAIDSMIEKINTFRVRIDCSTDSDCKIQEYGKKICGGPIGTFNYSIRDEEFMKFQDEIKKFNSADEAFIKKWNKGVLGTCDYNGRTEPVQCFHNKCT